MSNELFVSNELFGTQYQPVRQRRMHHIFVHFLDVLLRLPDEGARPFAQEPLEAIKLDDDVVYNLKQIDTNELTKH